MLKEKQIDQIVSLLQDDVHVGAADPMDEFQHFHSPSSSSFANSPFQQPQHHVESSGLISDSNHLHHVQPQALHNGQPMQPQFNFFPNPDYRLATPQASIFPHQSSEENNPMLSCAQSMMDNESEFAGAEESAMPEDIMLYSNAENMHHNAPYSRYNNYLIPLQKRAFSGFPLFETQIPMESGSDQLSPPEYVSAQMPQNFLANEDVEAAHGSQHNAFQHSPQVELISIALFYSRLFQNN